MNIKREIAPALLRARKVAHRVRVDQFGAEEAEKRRDAEVVQRLFEAVRGDPTSAYDLAEIALEKGIDNAIEVASLLERLVASGKVKVLTPGRLHVSMTAKAIKDAEFDATHGKRR